MAVTYKVNLNVDWVCNSSWGTIFYKDGEKQIYNKTNVANDQKQDIQKLLQQKGKVFAKENEYKLFGGYKNKEIIEDDLEVAEFKDLRFYKHKISFLPEPTNDYDPNAIKVYITYDEVPIHIGYVPKKDNIEFKKF